jgi:site-specific DNA-methyltransferase (adenine-specific)
MTRDFDKLCNQDCIEGLKQLPDGVVDLAFADPPFNIGYDYDVYHDKLESENYLAWSRDWTAEVARVLKPNGTFWLAIGDEYAAELKVMLQRDHKLTCRSWVVWYYTFGVNCKTKFSRSHAHLFYMTKTADDFTFNADAIRVPSARQLVYGDRRANPTGRLPDDTWILRPQDVRDSFTSEEDTWYFPRVCGTFKERAGWHGCQMPEQLLGRIIRACSHSGEVVLDPFAGSGTTLAVAKKLGRRYLGFELSGEYAARVEARLAGIAEGEPLDGAPEPLVSVPSTENGRKLADVAHKKTYVRKQKQLKIPAP